MKHIKQGPKECKLAVIAMLANQPLECIRSIACHIVGVLTWPEIFANTEHTDRLFFKAITTLINKFNLSSKILLFDDIVPLLNNTEAWSSGNTNKYLPNETLPLSGKGEMFIMWITNLAHSVAYDNGMIFDPWQDKEYPIEEWRTLPNNLNRVKFFII